MQQLTPTMRRCRQCVPTRVFAPRRRPPPPPPPPRLARSTAQRATRLTGVDTLCAIPVWAPRCSPSQRSLHNAPIFRLLLKVAVNGTHQCDFSNFCGAYGSQLPPPPHPPPNRVPNGCTDRAFANPQAFNQPGGYQTKLSGDSSLY